MNTQRCDDIGQSPTLTVTRQSSERNAAPRQGGCAPGAAVSELVNLNLKRAEGALGPFLIGVLLQVAVWLTILSRFAATVSTVRSDYSIPPYVFGIVASQGLLFTSFAVVHTCHISGVCDGESAELSYITLSFVSKAVLGMLLLFYALRLG